MAQAQSYFRRPSSYGYRTRTRKMAPSPTRATFPKRASLTTAFPDLEISGSSPSKPAPRRLSSALRGTFSRGYPPSISRGTDTSSTDITMKMSDKYRFYGDKDSWRTDLNIKDADTVADVSEDFLFTTQIVAEIKKVLNDMDGEPEDLEDALIEEMARAIYASNAIERVGPGLHETMDLCLAILRGEEVEYSERSDQYQSQLDAFTLRNLNVNNPEDRKVAISRKEAVQHAAAFQHIVNQFVKHNKPMTEALICKTHAILCTGISGEGAGVFSSKKFGGVYRKDDAWVGGGFKCPKSSDVRSGMASMVAELEKDIEQAVKLGELDPVMLAAKYCTRFVYLHPFIDGNGRMCRLLLNAILIKYIGIVVPMGEDELDRSTYLDIAAESRKVGGHPGQLGTFILKSTKGSAMRLKTALRRRLAKKEK